MDEQTEQRLEELLANISAGRPPLTRQDVTEAFTMRLFPLDAPFVEANPFAQFLRDRTTEGVRASVIRWDVILTTLEDRLKRKIESLHDRRHLRTQEHRANQRERGGEVGDETDRARDSLRDEERLTRHRSTDLHGLVQLKVWCPQRETKRIRSGGRFSSTPLADCSSG